MLGDFVLISFVRDFAVEDRIGLFSILVRMRTQSCIPNFQRIFQRIPTLLLPRTYINSKSRILKRRLFENSKSQILVLQVDIRLTRVQK